MEKEILVFLPEDPSTVEQIKVTKSRYLIVVGSYST
jgi:hypothetical protein